MRSAEPLPSAATNTLNPSARNRVRPATERVGVADDRIERARGQRGRIGIVGRVQHRHGLRLRVREQAVERQRQPRRAVEIERRAPGVGERLRERGLLVEQLLRAVAQPAGSNSATIALGGRRSGSRCSSATATAATTPCRRRSGLRRVAPTAPNPTAASSAARPRAPAPPSVASSSRTGKNRARPRRPSNADRRPRTATAGRPRRPRGRCAPDGRRSTGTRRRSRRAPRPRRAPPPGTRAGSPS